MTFEQDDNDAFAFTGRPNRQYLFVYGTNMHPDQVAERCANPVCLGPAVLPNHDIGFFGRTETWDGGMATAVSAPGEQLWGVVYELSYGDAQRLDVWQDARLDGAGIYFHYPARVLGQNGAWYSLLLYKKESMGAPAMPSRPMLDFIVAAARLRGLPEAYIDGLSHRPARDADYEVPMRGGYLKELRVVTSCRDCDV